MLQKNWNRNDNLHVFYSHRYNIGFNRKVKMTEEEINARKFAIESQKENEAEKKIEEARKNALKEGKDTDPETFSHNEKSFSGRPKNSKIFGVEPEQDKKAKNNRIIVSGKAAADSLMLAENVSKKDTEWLKMNMCQ